MALHAVSAAVWGLDGPATFPLRIVAPHGYLHAITCMYMIVLSGLGTFVNLGSLEGGPFQMIVTLYLLWWSFGVPGALFCAVIFGWVQVYPFNTSANSMHWRLQQKKKGLSGRDLSGKGLSGGQPGQCCTLCGAAWVVSCKVSSLSLA